MKDELFDMINDINFSNLLRSGNFLPAFRSNKENFMPEKIEYEFKEYEGKEEDYKLEFDKEAYML